MPKIYQDTTWLLFQIKCKDKHAEELQGSYKQPSSGGPDKTVREGKKKNSKRKGGNRCIRQKTFKINFFKSVAEFKLKMQLLKSCSDGKANLRILE